MARKIRALPPLEVLRSAFRLSEREELEQLVGGRWGAPLRESSGNYWRIRFDDRRWSEHRIVWALANNEQPTDEIDHINGEKKDNRPANLRHVTVAQNQWNRHGPPRTSSGRRGVFATYGKWVAEIGYNGQKIRSPVTDDFDLAVLYREEMERRFHGEYSPRPQP